MHIGVPRVCISVLLNVLLILIACICNSLDVPLLVVDDKKHWYGCILQSVYLCFRSLIRVHKILQVGMDYYHDLLSRTADCLTNMNIHDKKTDVVSIPYYFNIYNSILADISLTNTHILFG